MIHQHLVKALASIMGFNEMKALSYVVFAVIYPTGNC